MAGKTKYQIMLENGATDDELRQVLQGQGVAQSYLDREAQKAAEKAAAAAPTYQIWNKNFDGMSRIGADQGWTIDDSNAGTWKQIAQLANSGNTQAAINLANQLSAAGQFGGYWDDDGKYYGFAQGYTGGANASMQPVIGNQILTPKGLEYENTDVWLTPDGKALNYGQGGVLTNNGETWGTTEKNPRSVTGRFFETEPLYGDIRDTTWTAWEQKQGWDPAQTYSYMSQAGAFTNPELNTLEGNQARLEKLQANPNADPAAIAETQRAIQNQTIYQQALNSYSSPDAGNYGQTQPNSYQEYLAQYSAPAASVEPWNGSEYQKLRDEYLKRAADMEWNYNPDEDPVWQAYQKQYRREGQRATEDTLGRAAAMTGGMPSSYAVTAAGQAGNYYASQLSDKLPQLYQDAYNRYLQEYQRQLGLSDAYAGFDQTEYSRYLDALKQANYENETAYDRYRDTISDRRYDQEWAQQLREYADTQNWKATEWQQYLREYGDKLSQTEKEWAMQQAQQAAKNATPASYAYSQDGSVYDFSTALAKDFVANAPKGTRMRGSDGSIWMKDEYGNVSITKNGKTYYYGDQVPGQAQANGSGYRYTGGGNPRTAEEVYSPAPAPETPQGGGVQITNPVGNSGDTVNVDGQQFNWQELQRAYERGEVTAQYDERTGKYTFHTSTRKERIEDWNR